MISIVVLTRDEEENIADCLESMADADEVLVVDSFSVDRTVELARAHGASVIQREFDDFAGQRNFVLDEAPLKNDWILFLDADERLNPELWRECLEAARRDERSGYLVAGKMMFMGRWLRRAATYPVYQMRLLKRGEVRFVQQGHGQREGASTRGLGTLREGYAHYSFSKGLDDWLARHRVYARAEALAAWREISAGSSAAGGGLFAADPVARRRALRRLSFRLPCRALLRFVYMYVWRLGCLDGRPGYVYCRLLARYERMISCELARLRRDGRGAEISA